MIRRTLSIFLCVILFFGLSSCEERESPNDDYNEGYIEGYNDGFIKGQKELGSYAETCFSDACGSTYGIEEALTVLTLYADGEPISEEELFDAIQVVDSFYEEVCDIFRDIKDYYKYQ